MTFEEWWEREDRVYLNEYSTFKIVAAQAWKYQQERINELEAQLEVADIRPMGESEYLKRIEELENDLKYWQDIAINEEYDKTLTGDRAV